MGTMHPPLAHGMSQSVPKNARADKRLAIADSAGTYTDIGQVISDFGEINRQSCRLIQS